MSAELPALALNKDRFLSIGTRVSVSNLNSILICNNKYKLYTVEQEVKAAAEDLNTKLTELYGPSDQKGKVKFKYSTAEVKWTDDFGNVLIMDANIYSGISLTYIWSKADETLQEIKKLSEGDKINPAGVKDGL